MDFEFRPRVGASVIAALAALVLLSLAVWQMGRFLEKSELEDEWARRRAAEPVVLQSLDDFDAEALDYYRARARGTLDPSRVALYDFRRFRGEPGCFLVSPMNLVDGGTILVLRGFVPHTRQTRCEDAAVSAPTEPELLGLMHTLDPNLADEANRSQSGDQLQWDTFDIEGTYAAWDIDDGPQTPTVLVLDEQHVGDPFPLASYEHVAAPYLTSMRHLNYAGTWLLTLLFVAGIWAGTSIKRVDAA